MDGFFGWKAEHGRGGWYACKVMERGECGRIGLVRKRHLLVNVSVNAPRPIAEKEIRRLYMVGALQ